MIQMSVPKYLWSDAVLSACYLINMISSVLNKRSPFSYLYAKKPFSMTSRVFECTCFIQDLSLELDKLSPRSMKCVFVGYSRTQKGYQCYNLSIRKYFVSADVTFFDSVPYFSSLYSITDILSQKLFFAYCLYRCQYHYMHLLLMTPRPCHWQTLKTICIKTSSVFQIHLHSLPKSSCL